MERRISEENITKSIMNWLEKQGWFIVCYDFPQSGTGRMLHANDVYNSKNKYTFIPDIVAIKGGNSVFFENKDRFYLPDFEKLEAIRLKNNYSISISQLLSNYYVSKIYFGIGLPVLEHNKTKVNLHRDKVDFIIHSDGVCSNKFWQRKKIF